MNKIMLFCMATMFSMLVYSQDKKIIYLKVNQLPQESQKFISANLPGIPITRAGKIEEKSGLTYVAFVEINGKQHAYLFDKDGKFTGKGDNLVNNKKTAPVAKPPIKTQETKTLTKTPTTDNSVHKK